MSDMPDYVRAVYTSVKNTWQDAENLDDTHGYTTYIWVPEETFKMDIIKLHIYAEKFRAHSKAALAGGAQTKTSTTATPSHTHDVAVGTKTSVAGGAHSHSVTGATSSAQTAAHTHDVVIGTKTSTSSGAHRHVVANYTGAPIPDPLTKGYSMNVGFEEAMAVNFNVAEAKTLNTWEEAAAHAHDVAIGTKTSASGGASHSHTVSGQAAEAVANHAHDVAVGTVTSESGAGAHSHGVTIDDHTHPIDFGIYEEDIAGRTLSAVLYDPDGNVLKDFGVLLTGEDSDVIDLSEYFASLKYGMYRMVLSASGRLRARLVFYELCKMYAQF